MKTVEAKPCEIMSKKLQNMSRCLALVALVADFAASAPSRAVLSVSGLSSAVPDLDSQNLQGQSTIQIPHSHSY